MVTPPPVEVFKPEVAYIDEPESLEYIFEPQPDYPDPLPAKVTWFKQPKVKAEPVKPEPVKDFNIQPLHTEESVYLIYKKYNIDQDYFEIGNYNT